MLCFNDLVLFFFLRFYNNKLFYFQFVLSALHCNRTKLFKQCLEGDPEPAFPLLFHDYPEYHFLSHSTSRAVPVKKFWVFPETNPHCISIKSRISRVCGSFSRPPPPTLSVAGARKDGIREKIKPISSLVERPEVVVLF